MRFKLDENLPVELAAELQLAGHDTDTVLDENLKGASDPVVVETARDAGRILLTLDKGIANLIRHPLERHAGVVLFRPGSSGRAAVLGFIRSRLSELLLHDLEHRVTVVSDTRIRFR
jgi:predicted nuclease of predicted toxin-antitoxin system